MPVEITYTGTAEPFSDRGLLLLILNRLNEMETTVSELSAATGELRSAVTGLSERLNPLVEQVGALQAANTELSRTLSDERLADEVEDEGFRAEIVRVRDQLDTAVTDSTAAVESIRTDVTSLNQLASDQPA